HHTVLIPRVPPAPRAASVCCNCGIPRPEALLALRRLFGPVLRSKGGRACSQRGDDSTLSHAWPTLNGRDRDAINRAVAPISRLIIAGSCSRASSAIGLAYGRAQG